MKILWHFLLVVLLATGSRQRFISRWSETTNPALLEESLRKVASHLNPDHDNADLLSKASNVIFRTRFFNGIHIKLCFTLEQQRWKCFLYKSVVKTLSVQYENCTRLQDEDSCDHIGQEEIKKKDQETPETNDENNIEDGKTMNDELDRHVQKETNKKHVNIGNNYQDTPNEGQSNMRAPEETLDQDKAADDEEPDEKTVNKDLNSNDKNIADQREHQPLNTNNQKIAFNRIKNRDDNPSNRVFDNQNENVQVDNRYDHDHDHQERQKRSENTINRVVPDTREANDKNLSNEDVDRDNADDRLSYQQQKPENTNDQEVNHDKQK